MPHEIHVGVSVETEEDWFPTDLYAVVSDAHETVDWRLLYIDDCEEFWILKWVGRG